MRSLARLLPRAVCPVRPRRSDLAAELPTGERSLGLLVVGALVLALLA